MVELKCCQQSETEERQAAISFTPDPDGTCSELEIKIILYCCTLYSTVQ